MTTSAASFLKAKHAADQAPGGAGRVQLVVVVQGRLRPGRDVAGPVKVSGPLPVPLPVPPPGPLLQHVHISTC